MKPFLPCAVFLCLTRVISQRAGYAEDSVKAATALAGQRLMVLGDSITQAGDYVSFIEYYLDKHFPNQQFDIVSLGLSSETASGLSEKLHPYPRPDVHERLERALDKVKPDVVMLCYGMNDGIYHPQSPERMKAFQDGITSVLAAVKARGARVMLLTPPIFDAAHFAAAVAADAPDFSYRSPYKGYDDVLAGYAKWETTLNEPGVMVIDLHTPILGYLQTRRAKDPQYPWGDGIHPGPAGHLLMAHIILRAFGLQLPDTGLDAELDTINEDPLWKLVKAHREKRSEGWLPYVGYTREQQKVNALSVTDVESTASALQQQIDRQRKAIPPVR